MTRILEVEVMDSQDSVDQYSGVTADGGISITFVDRLKSKVNLNGGFKLVDIGCGNFGYYKQLRDTYPEALITGYEASQLMLDVAVKGVRGGAILELRHIPDQTLPSGEFDLVISSLCLHQMPNAQDLWDAIKQLGKSGATFAVFDLLRVEGKQADQVVESCAGQAPEIFKQDFKNSLRAAFTFEEVQSQLADAGLTGSIEVIELMPECNAFCVIGQLG